MTCVINSGSFAPAPIENKVWKTYTRKPLLFSDWTGAGEKGTAW